MNTAFVVITIILVFVLGLSNYLVDKENIFELNILFPLIVVSAMISLTITLIIANFGKYRGRFLGIIIMPLIGLIPTAFIFIFSVLINTEEAFFGVALAVILGLLGLVLGLITGIISLLLGVKK